MSKTVESKKEKRNGKDVLVVRVSSSGTTLEALAQQVADLEKRVAALEKPKK